VVWDEIIAFWLVLLVIAPSGFAAQCAAFVLFRFFDAAKPGPVGWADRLYKPKESEPVSVGWREGWGIIFDDLVAAACALFCMALWKWFWA
jgi:phosphatidylglycerophosphatase A